MEKRREKLENDPWALLKLWLECERVIQLPDSEDLSEIFVKSIYFDGDVPIDFMIDISKGEFDALLQPYLE